MMRSMRFMVTWLCASDDTSQIARYWQSGNYNRKGFRWGWMPPHPTVYLRRQHFIDYGGYRVDFQISSDYELLIRMLTQID